MTAPAAATLQRIELEALALRRRLDAAAQTLTDYDAEIAPIRDRYAPQIRRHAAEIRQIKEGLLALIQAAPDLFRKPKSQILHGIKVGLRKASDVWAWPTDPTLVALIKELCTPEQQDAFLVTTTVGRKDAIPPEARRAMGIGCTAGADTPICDEQATGTGAALLALLAQLPETPAEAPAPAKAEPKASKPKRTRAQEAA
jgi:hypothetical protein